MSTAWSSSREAYGWGKWWNGWCMREKKLEALEEAAMAFIEEHARAFHREAMPTLSLLAQRPNLAHLWLAVTGLLTAGLDPEASGAAGDGGAAADAAGGSGGAAQT